MASVQNCKEKKTEGKNIPSGMTSGEPSALVAPFKILFTSLVKMSQKNTVRHKNHFFWNIDDAGLS
jgi:hypothetical protein